jgi:hypothetical protein
MNPMKPDAKTQLERQYHEMRWRLLSLAADFDRLQRMPGGETLLRGDGAAGPDERIAELRACAAELMSDEPGRAERVQMKLSDTTPPPGR